MSKLNIKKPLKIVFYSPYAAIWQHSIPEAILAKALQDQGHHIKYLSCDGWYNRGCIGMAAVGVDCNAQKVERIKVCVRCKYNRDHILKKFGFHNDLIEHYINSNEKKTIQNIINALPLNNFDFEYDGVRLGRVALYHIILRYKVIELRFSSIQWQEYLLELEHVLMTYIASINYFRQEQPDRVIIYNTRYPTNNAVRIAAKKMAIQPYFIHAGSNMAHQLGSILIGKNDHSDILLAQLVKWQELKRVPCTDKVVKYISEHFQTLVYAKTPFVYSQPSTGNTEFLLDYFSLRKTKSVCVAIISSADEHYAQYVFENFLPPRLKNIPFASQEEWLQELIKYFTVHSEHTLIIRPHPRIFPNKREGVSSPFADKLRKILSNLPDNVKINWPEQNISLYALSGIADVFLNSWSSVGKEMSLLGIPVLSYGHSWLPYPFDMNYLGKTKQDYFEQLALAIKTGWDFGICVKAFRWYAIEQVYSVIHHHENFNHKHKYTFSLSSRIKHKVNSVIDPNYEIKKSLKKMVLDQKESVKLNNLISKEQDTLLDDFNTTEYTDLDYSNEKDLIKKAVWELIGMVCGDQSQTKFTLANKFKQYFIEVEEHDYA